MSTKTKNFLVITSIFLLIGITGLGWMKWELRKEEKQQQQNDEIFKHKLAQIADPNKDQKDLHAFAHTFTSTAAVKTELARLQERSKQKKAKISLALIASITCLSMAGTCLASWLLFTTVRIIIKVISAFFVCISRYKERRKARRNELFKTTGQKVVWNQEADNIEKVKANQPVRNKLGFDHSKKDDAIQDDAKIEVLYCDEKSLMPGEKPSPPKDSGNVNTKQLNELQQNICKTILSGYFQNATRIEDSIRTQNEDLLKQMAELGHITQAVRDTSGESYEPLANSLGELTQHVSAIREYAYGQQTRIEKLQAGYDWNIIRTFCLKLVRCIDNLENRIAKLSKQNIDTTDLEEIMDEMLFALESSGIEQFRPDINSDYRGQEKTAEVVKDRIFTDSQDLSGKIAEVIKPGYQYVIDDENVKIVRIAQVKLFD